MSKIFLFLLLACPLVLFAQIPGQITTANVTGKLYRYKNFPSRFAETRNVDVWLPENYSTNKRYAVLYMHDGQNLFDAKDAIGGVEWNVDETAQRLINEGKIRDTIVVGIWNTAHRVAEYSPQKAFDLINRRDIKQSEYVTPREGESDKYLKFIVSELKPFIDQNYSTKPDRENTFIMGSSMGGLMSIYAISEYPEVFGGAASLSTQFPLGQGVMLEYMKKFLPPPKTHRIYFDYGTETLDAPLENYQKQADQILKQKGYKQNKNWVTKKFPGADHTEKSWRERLDVPLLFLLSK